MQSVTNEKSPALPKNFLSFLTYTERNLSNVWEWKLQVGQRWREHKFGSGEFTERGSVSNVTPNDASALLFLELGRALAVWWLVG